MALLDDNLGERSPCSGSRLSAGSWSYGSMGAADHTLCHEVLECHRCAYSEHPCDWQPSVGDDDFLASTNLVEPFTQVGS